MSLNELRNDEISASIIRRTSKGSSESFGNNSFTVRKKMLANINTAEEHFSGNNINSPVDYNSVNKRLMRNFDNYDYYQ